MSDKASADEAPKKKIAKRVITSKRRYFFPETGKSYRADTLAQAIGRHKQSLATKKDKAGDE